MSRYAKFVSERTVEPAPKVIVEGGRYTANPKPELLASRGYKPLVVDPQPETGEEEMLEARYQDTATAVLQHWVVIAVDLAAGEGGGDE